MALFNLGKKKKETGGNLTDQIGSMRQLGYADDQVIQALQGQGHTSSEIYDAISKADVAGGAPMAPSGQPEQYPPGPMPGQDDYEQPLEQPMQPEQAPYQPVEDNKEKIEQIAEAIIDEKWNDLIKDINKVVELNKKTESRLAKIEGEVKNIKDNFDSLHKGVLGKITEYDKNLVNVGTEIKAMEKVFQKILPTFTENVNKLSRLTTGVKTSKKR